MSPDNVKPQLGCPLEATDKLLPEAAPEKVKLVSPVKVSQASTHSEPCSVRLQSEGVPSDLASGPAEERAR
jgi:hypothetical protein